MPWKRGTELKKTSGDKSPLLHWSLEIQAIDPAAAADAEKGLRIRGVAASDKVNAGRVRIRASAWKINKPTLPMLYEHGYDPTFGKRVIGRWDTFTAKEGTGLLIEGWLQHPDLIEDVKAKRLTQLSIGHIPDSADIATQDGIDFLDVTSTTLRECSLVAVPMDDDADMEPIAASLGYVFEAEQTRTQAAGGSNNGGVMDRKLLIQLLNMQGAKLADDANDAQVLAAMQQLATTAQQGAHFIETCQLLGLDPAKTTPETVKQKLAEWRSPEKWVEKEKYDALNKTAVQSEIDKLIAQHTEIPKDSIPFAKTLLEQGIGPETPGRKLFDTWTATLPKIRTTPVVGQRAALPPRQGELSTQEGEALVLTQEDVAMMQTIGYFRDELDANGRVVMTGRQRMAQMAEMTGREAQELLLGQSIPETQLDRAERQQREYNEQHEERI